MAERLRTEQPQTVRIFNQNIFICIFFPSFILFQSVVVEFKNWIWIECDERMGYSTGENNWNKHPHNAIWRKTIQFSIESTKQSERERSRFSILKLVEPIFGVHHFTCIFRLMHRVLCALNWCFVYFVYIFAREKPNARFQNILIFSRTHEIVNW